MTTATAATTTATASGQQHPAQRQDSLLDEELPPAYTPSANINQGEATIEYGPSRPFQAPPPLPAPRPTSHTSHSGSSRSGGGGSHGLLGTLWNHLSDHLQDRADRSNASLSIPSRRSGHNSGRLTPQPTGGSWSSYPGRQHQQAYSAPSGPPPALSRSNSGGSGGDGGRFLAPLSRHPASSSMTDLRSDHVRPPPTTASSDFARDFYAVGDDVSVDEFGGTRGGGVMPPLAAAPVAGKPTTTPTPGHPYLHNNQLLVYPKGYECDKCDNIGYKLPSLKPCKKCWPKYGKPFTGPLAYSFGEAAASSSSSSSTITAPASNFQRPLPNPPPIGPPRHNRNSYPGALPTLLTPQPTGFSSSSSHSRYRSPPSPPLLPRSLIGSFAAIPTRRQMYRDSPGFAPHAGCHSRGGGGGGNVVYNAGDPRLGGRLCWRCDGYGTVSFMLFDREQCPACGGIGRTFA